MGLFDLPLHPSELLKSKLRPNGTWSHALDPQKIPIQDNDVILARLRSVSCSFCVLFLPGDLYSLEKPPQTYATWWKGRSPAIGNVLQEQRFNSLSSPELNFMQTWFWPIKITKNVKEVKSRPQSLCRRISPETNGSLVEKGTDWNINEKDSSLSLLMKINRSFNYINHMKDQALICCCILNVFREAHLFWKQKKCNSLY